MDTLELRENGFCEELAERSGVPLTETQQLIGLIIRMQGTQVHDLTELRQINEIIEDFKHKAKMI